MMRRSLTIGHAPAAAAVMSLAASDRLRLYRRCFHELEEQMLQLKLGGRDSEIRRLQAEVRSLEELIMVFTELNPVISKSKIRYPPDAWMTEAAVEGLDVSLVTDILLLSATSPWTVFVADRIQWLVCYVSPSAKCTIGWTPQELVGTAAWSACHPDDIFTLQRMLHLRDNEQVSGGSVIYRRMRKDRSYSTVQATGRAVGTRWYAWVEQDILNFSPMPNQEEYVHGDQNKVVAKTLLAPKPVLEREMSSANRIQRQSPTLIPPLPESPNPTWEAVSRPTSPIKRVTVVEPMELQRNKGKGRVGSEFDAATEMPKPADNGIVNNIQLTEMHARGQESTVTATRLNLNTDGGAEQGEAGLLVATSGLGEEVDSSTTIDARTIAAAQGTCRVPTSSSSNQLLSTASPGGKELLKGRKVLLVEDDMVNRKIGQRLLKSLECNVTVTCNGQEALDVLQQSHFESNQALGAKELPPQFDLVLMDLQMPIMDGTKAVQRFRQWEEEQEPARQRMTIFALTANVSDRDMVKCAQSGFDEFVSKPLTIEKLVERLKKLNQDPGYIRELDL